MGTKDRIFYPKKELFCDGKEVNLEVPQIMGILNVTPDSFYAESRTLKSKVLLRCEKMLKEGALFIDVGGQSTRPGAISVGAEEEIMRTVPVINTIVKNFPEVLVSIDTYSAPVAEAAIDAGASIVNDVSGGNLDPNMFSLIAKYDVPYILTHMQGSPENMQKNPIYGDITSEIIDSLRTKLTELKRLGARQVLIDPGFGFGKTVKQNYTVLEELQKFTILNQPILVGFSRKSMIYKLLDSTPEQALNGTSILNTLALERGAQILRVHDVKEAAECITLWSACSNQGA